MAAQRPHLDLIVEVNNELDMVRQRVESANSRLEDGPSAALTSSARAEEKSTLAQGVALCQDTTKGHQALHKPWTTVANLVRKALATDVQDLMKVIPGASREHRIHQEESDPPEHGSGC